jgi:hypothetical protein
MWLAINVNILDYDKEKLQEHLEKLLNHIQIAKAHHLILTYNNHHNSHGIIKIFPMLKYACLYFANDVRLSTTL